eukprot:SAG31_NODE_20_length_34168_cov_33.651296_6_plen_81_part_00
MMATLLQAYVTSINCGEVMVISDAWDGVTSFYLLCKCSHEIRSADCSRHQDAERQSVRESLRHIRQFYGSDRHCVSNGPT